MATGAWMHAEELAEYVDEISLDKLEYIEAYAYDDEWEELGRFLGFVEKAGFFGGGKRKEFWVKLKVLAAENSYYWWFATESYANPGWHHVCSGVPAHKCRVDGEAVHLGRWRCLHCICPRFGTGKK